MQTIYYAISVLVVFGGLIWKSARFFGRMDQKIDGLTRAVGLIINNHLPHIYERLGERKAYEARQDSFGNSGRDRANEGRRYNSHVEGISNGGSESGMEGV